MSQDKKPTKRASSRSGSSKSSGKSAGRKRAAPRSRKGSGTGSPAPQPPSGPDRIFAFADSVQAPDEERHETEEPEQTWVSFRLSGETFALPVERVDEVLRVHSITRVPHAPYPVRGVTNHRGRVLPVVDLRLRLRLEEQEITPTSRILVTRSQSRAIGLLVDAVHQLVQIRASGITPPPPDVMTEQSYYLVGVSEVEDDLLILLDVDRVLEIHDTNERRVS